MDKTLLHLFRYSYLRVTIIYIVNHTAVLPCCTDSMFYQWNSPHFHAYYEQKVHFLCIFKYYLLEKFKTYPDRIKICRTSIGVHAFLRK